MDQKNPSDELDGVRLADYPSGYDPAVRITAGIQETWEIHPSEKDPARKGKRPPRDSG